MNNKSNYSKKTLANLRTLVILSRATQTIHRQEVKTIQDAGLTVSQFGVLEVLYHKGPLRISTITEKILSTGGNMTVVINNLVKDKLITKSKDPGDKRATIVKLTRKGKTLMSQYFPPHIENINQIFSPLNDIEKQQLTGLLKKLVGNR